MLCQVSGTSGAHQANERLEGMIYCLLQRGMMILDGKPWDASMRGIMAKFDEEQRFQGSEQEVMKGLISVFRKTYL